MAYRGRWKRFAALAAALGVALGNTGCVLTGSPGESLFGRSQPGSYSYGGPGPHGQSYSDPAGYGHQYTGPAAHARHYAGPAGHGEIVRTSYPSSYAQGALVPTMAETAPPPHAGYPAAHEGAAPVPGALAPNCPVPGHASPGGPVVPGGPHMLADPGPIPTEKAMVSHPPYRIAPPDILFLDMTRVIPKGPYRLDAMDTISLLVTNTLPNQPIAAKFTIAPDGTINLGFTYGAVRVAGMTPAEAEAAIRMHLGRVLRDPQVAIVVDQFRTFQQVRGEHLVRQDGTISLGTYGCVAVAGLTLGQARCEIERHLSQHLRDPEVAVDVFSYNSRYYYVIADGGGYGQQVIPIPITGNETVLDAIAKIGGLPIVSSKRYIWVARPAPADHDCTQILPVDWDAITKGGATRTNYQLFPGDRVYIKADPLIATDNMIAKILSPVERVLGVTLLGATTVQTFRNNGDSGAFIAVP